MSDVLGTIGQVIDILDEVNARQSCVVRVINQTDVPLRRLDDGHSSGDFVSLPADEIPPGAEDVFSSADRQGSFMTGAEGFVVYEVGRPGTTWTIRWDNPAVSFDGNDSSATLAGTEAGLFQSSDRIGGGHEKVDTRFTLRKAGSGPGPGPGPTPPGQDRQATALITIHNQSNSVLTLVDQGHDHGGFMTFPDTRIAPGGSSTFASVETEGSPQEGSQGFVVFNAGIAGTCAWTVQWNNPEGADNTTTFTLVGPEAPLYQAVDQVGQGDENVPVVFTIFGGPEQPVPPVPPPIDPPIDPPINPPVAPPEPFVQPVEQDEPTLRFGDDNPDGWVEYLQQLLNTLGFGPVPENGDFDQTTLGAVRTFQTKRRLLVDGVVGNQTWASLREEEARPPSTDGLPAHTFVEVGQEARWFTEDNAVQYDAAEDVLFLVAHSTGTEAIGLGEAVARVFITLPDGQRVDVDVPGEPDGVEVAGPGDRLFFRIGEVRATHGPGPYQVEAFLPQHLGGDQTARTLGID